MISTGALPARAGLHQVPDALDLVIPCPVLVFGPRVMGPARRIEYGPDEVGPGNWNDGQVFPKSLAGAGGAAHGGGASLGVRA